MKLDASWWFLSKGCPQSQKLNSTHAKNVSYDSHTQVMQLSWFVRVGTVWTLFLSSHECVASPGLSYIRFWSVEVFVAGWWMLAEGLLGGGIPPIGRHPTEANTSLSFTTEATLFQLRNSFTAAMHQTVERLISGCHKTMGHVHKSSGGLTCLYKSPKSWTASI